LRKGTYVDEGLFAKVCRLAEIKICL